MRPALALVLLFLLVVPVTLHPHAVEPQKQVLIVISEPLNDLYDQGYRDFIYRLNATIHEKYNYSTNFRLASAVQVTPDIAANYSMVIVLFPKISSRYNNETTVDALLTFLELENRSFLLIGNTSDMNTFLRRFGREIGESVSNVTAYATFTEPILAENYTFSLNETATIVKSDAENVTTPPYRYPKDYDTYDVMMTNASKAIAVAAETVDNTRFFAFSAVEALKENSTAPRSSIFRNVLDRLMGYSYGKISVSSRNIETPAEIKEGDLIKAWVNVNATPGKPEVYLEVYRGTVMAAKIPMKALNDTYYEGSREAEIGQADVMIVIHVRGYGYRTSEPIHVIVYPNRQPVPLDPVLAALFLISFIATLAGLIIVRREMRNVRTPQGTLQE